METGKHLLISRITGIIDIALDKVSETLSFERQINERSFDDILKNPEDKRKFEKAVEELKQARSKKTEELTLSDNEKITISIS